MTDDIPADVHKYAESPIFTENTVPEKLTTLHDTKSGVWGRLCVLDGRLKYIIPGPPLLSSIIKAGDIGIIRPEELHRVEMIGPVKFKIEFCRQ